jgi:Tetraspanin family
MVVADGDLLVLITWAASMLLLTAGLGMTGTLLNSRPILAIYAVLLWPAFVSLLSVGYVAYKRDTLSLDHKLNLAWSRYYNPLSRLRIQDSLQCCGFYSSLHAASASKQCYLRAPLPGCKGNFYNFEHQNLSRIWRATFALVPLHMVNLVVALLCANHVTNTFRKGITPKRYRLSAADVKADAEKILDNVASFFRPKVSPPGFFKSEKEGLVRSL